MRTSAPLEVRGPSVGAVADGDGKCGKDEVHRALLEVGYDATPEETEALFGVMDVSGDGTLDYQEVHNLLSTWDTGEEGIVIQLTNMLAQARARTLDNFRRWDTNGDGRIGRDELKRGLLDLGYDAPAREVRALFASLDKDGSGAIEYKEMHRTLRRVEDAQSEVALRKQAQAQLAAQAAMARVGEAKARAAAAARAAAEEAARVWAAAEVEAEAEAAARAAEEAAARAAAEEAAAKAAEEEAAAMARAAAEEAAASQAAEAAEEAEAAAREAAEMEAAAAEVWEAAAVAAVAAAELRATEEAAALCAVDESVAAATAMSQAEADAASAASDAAAAQQALEAAEAAAAAREEGRPPWLSLRSAAVARRVAAKEAAAAAARVAAAASTAASMETERAPTTSDAGDAADAAGAADAETAAGADGDPDPDGDAAMASEAGDAVPQRATGWVAIRQGVSTVRAINATVAAAAARVAAAAAATAAATTSALESLRDQDVADATGEAAKEGGGGAEGATDGGGALSEAAARTAEADATKLRLAATQAMVEMAGRAEALESASAGVGGLGGQLSIRQMAAVMLAANAAARRVAAAAAAALAAESESSSSSAAAPVAEVAVEGEPRTVFLRAVAGSKGAAVAAAARVAAAAAAAVAAMASEVALRRGAIPTTADVTGADNPAPTLEEAPQPSTEAPQPPTPAAAVAPTATRPWRPSGAIAAAGGGGRRQHCLPILDWSRRQPKLDEAVLEAAFGTALADVLPRTVWLHANALTPAAGAIIGARLTEHLTAHPERGAVRRLGLAETGIGDGGVGGLLSCLTEESGGALVSLSLTSNGITAAGAQLLMSALVAGSLTLLSELRIGANPLGIDGAVAIADALRSVQCPLVSLHLGRSQIGDQGGEAIADALLGRSAAAVATTTSVRTLHLPDCGMRARAAAAFARLLASPSCQLVELSLSNNPLSAQGGAAVAASLQESRTLSHAWLEATQIDDMAAPAIATALLTDSCPLAVLALSRNALSDTGVAAIAASLLHGDSTPDHGPKPTPRLRKLWISDTEMTTEGARALVEAARGVTADEVASASADAHRLQQLWLGGQGARAIGADAREALLACACDADTGQDGALARSPARPPFVDLIVNQRS